MNSLKVRILCKFKEIFSVFAAMVILLGFHAVYAEATASSGTADSANVSQTALIDDEPTPLSSASGSKVMTPVASGKVVKTGGSATVDMSNAAEGYIMAKYTGSGKIKIQITKSGKKTTYTYNLSTTGNYEVFPLTQGDGTYTINVYKNVSGNQYSLALGTSVKVELRNSLLPFMYPSQYVNFNAKSQAVQKSAQLAQGASGQIGIVSAVYNYVVANTSYDSQKASSVKSGYLPVIDNTLSTRKGICFDYASLTAAMLRSQGIPTRLEVGYAGKAYHAWISVYTKETGWVNNVIYFDGKNWKLMDPTFASSGGQSTEIMQYIGNGSNYSTVYIY